MARRRQEAQQRKVRIIMGIVVVFLMVFSIFGIFVGQQSATSTNYGDYNIEVDPTTGMQLLDIGDITYAFYYHPSLVSYIDVPQEAIWGLQGAEIIIYTHDPAAANQDAIEQAKYDLSQYIPVPHILAATRAEGAYADYSIYDCTAATPTTAVVYFEQGNTTNITMVGNCIVVSATAGGFLQARDALLYHYLGVIDGQAN
ncbi:MAG: hypothetical protein ABIH41_07450 [Nanoarchaeota archaeon]